MGTTREIDNNSITHGTIWKQILFFFFPIFFGTVFQQLYNTVDAVIVGRILGKQALAAVGGGTSTAINLTIGFITGLSSGATVIISQFFGAEDSVNVNKAVHNASALALWGGIAVSVLGYITARPLLVAIETPEEVLEQAVLYMHIYFAGSLFVVIYNIGSSIFRAFGDSKSPLYFLIAGCVTNIVCDVLFVKYLNMGIAGAAYATVLSQFISSFLVVLSLKLRTDCCKLEFRQIKFNRRMLKSTVAIGIPTGVQSVIYSISNLLITSSINVFGTDCAAGLSAFIKLDNINWMITNSFGIAITTFAGQNYGAGLFDRVKKGTRDCIGMLFASSILVSLFLCLFGRQGMLLFTTDESVIDWGMRMIITVCPYYALYAFVEIPSGTLRGAGKTVGPTIITLVVICGIRSLWLIVVPRFVYTLESIFYCYPVTWMLAAIAMTAWYKTSKIYTVGERI